MTFKLVWRKKTFRNDRQTEKTDKIQNFRPIKCWPILGRSPIITNCSKVVEMFKK